MEEAGWTSRVGMGINDLLSCELNSDFEVCVARDVTDSCKGCLGELQETVF